MLAKTLTVDEASAYLWWFMGELQGNPDEAWTSYGVHIGAANMEMNARGILQQGQALAGEAIAASEAAGTFKEQLWMAVICTAPYRLHGGLRPDYKWDITVLGFLST